MVLGILTAIAACPAIIGTTEAVKQGQHKNAKEKHRGLKSNLIVSCAAGAGGRGRSSREVDGGVVVLRGGKLWVAVPPSSDDEDELGLDDSSSTKSPPHLFAGYFLPYPETKWSIKGEGFVSTISDDPPQLAWIYVDIDTHEVKYGNRVESERHVVGPWDVTPAERRICLEGWEGFLAVWEEGERGEEGREDGRQEDGQGGKKEGGWALYFDRDDDGLRGLSGEKRRRCVEVELGRRERRKGRDEG